MMSDITTQVWDWLQEVKDPEIPALSIVDLGIVRNVELNDSGDDCVVTITPTYSGCPAMLVIAESIDLTLKKNGIQHVELKTQLSPAWTTDWMSEAGKQKLKDYGIAPPRQQSVAYQKIDISLLIKNRAEQWSVPCPKCGSINTTATSRFGSTSCKALYVCNDCHEPFDYFKSH